MVAVWMAALPAVCAGDCVPPRASGADYPACQDVQNATIAAARIPPELGKKILPPEVIKDYVVVEVAVFPHAGQTADVDAFDFGLKFSNGELTHPRTPEEIVSMWEEAGAPRPPAKARVTAETGVVYTHGNDPATGRSHGWGTYSDVSVGPDQPPAPPGPQSPDPRVFQANVRARALPEGPAARPVAGYLYFPWPSKKRKNVPVELQYLKDGVLATLPFAAR